MAGTLFDALSAKLSGNDEDPTLIGGQQQQMSKALQAGSGKAGTSTGAPGASNVTEQAAIAQGQAQLGQAAGQAKLVGQQVQQAAGAEQQQAQTAAAGLKTQQGIAQQNLATQSAAAAAGTAGTEQQATAQTQASEALKIQALNVQADQAVRQLASEKQISMDNIFRTYKQSQADLAFRNDASELEHVGQVLALRDKAYVDEITRIGQERQLDDKNNFQEEAERLTLGNQLDQLDTQLNFKSALNGNQRQWDQYLASLGYDASALIAQAAVRDAAQVQMWSGAGTAATAGFQAYSKFGSDSKETTPYDKQFQDNGEGTTNSVLSNGDLAKPNTQSLDATNLDTGNTPGQGNA